MAQTKQQKEIVTLVVLVFIAGLVWYGLVGKNRTGAAGFFQVGPYEPINVEDYRGQIRQLENTRDTAYKPSGRNIFVARPSAPEGPSGAKTAKAADPKRPIIYDQPQLPPPPPKPELNMKFFGLGATPANGPRRAFLQDGDDVLIVGEGDTIKNHIRITHIGNDRIEFEDINTGMKNSTVLEMPPAPQ